MDTKTNMTQPLHTLLPTPQDIAGTYGDGDAAPEMIGRLWFLAERETLRSAILTRLLVTAANRPARPWQFEDPTPMINAVLGNNSPIRPAMGADPYRHAAIVDACVTDLEAHWWPPATTCAACDAEFLPLHSNVTICDECEND